jgi:hypothetical protein
MTKGFLRQYMIYGVIVLKTNIAKNTKNSIAAVGILHAAIIGHNALKFHLSDINQDSNIPPQKWLNI